MTSPLNWYPKRSAQHSYDELVDVHGEMRPGWREVARLMENATPADLSQRVTRCDHFLSAHGATYLPHRELLEGHRRVDGWRLDPIPFVLGSDEWAALEDMVAERASMLAVLATDLAGRRETLRSGVVPAAAVYSDPSFLPTVPPGDSGPIVWYGADLVRTSSGEWRVLRDGTDAVRGVGEALMHRSVLLRALGDLGDRLSPAPLSGFLSDFRGTLARRAPAGVSSPRTVVLAPDEISPAFVATSYLSSQLGFHRSTPADLVVRDGRVFLRSLGGREPVDVLLRAVRAVDSDPLASPARGRGVPGLVTAERDGSVAVANPFAGALVGSASLAPHLDAALDHLIGRRPALRSLGAQWCGNPDVCAEVLADPAPWVLEDVFRGTATFGTELVDDTPGGAGARWREALRLRPTSVVARRRAEFATAPVATSGAIEPGSVVIGVSALVDGDRVHVMPGAFARVVDPAAPVASQRSGWAKDVWVYRPARQRASVTMRPSTLPQVDLRMSLPTRAAEAMFWLGRAAEGVELRARTIRAVSERMTADPVALSDDGAAWQRAALGLLRSAGVALAPDVSNLSDALATALDGRSGLLEQLDALLRAASTVREFLSTTTGRVLADIAELRVRIRVDDNEALEQLLVSLAALAGLTQESTVRGPAWRLLDLGRRLERAIGVLGAMEPAFGTTPSAGSLQAIGETLLAAHESLVAYRRWHRTDIEIGPAVDLLTHDDTNPRSVAYQLDRIGEHLVSLPLAPGSSELLSAAAGALHDSADVTAMVLSVRGPLLELAGSVAEHWFSDHISAQRLGEVER